MAQVKTGRDKIHHVRRGCNPKLQVSVTRGQHGREARDFLLATATFARLFKMPMTAHGFKRAFAIDFLLQSTQCPIYWFAFFLFNFCQRNSLPSSCGKTPQIDEQSE